MRMNYENKRRTRYITLFLFLCSARAFATGYLPTLQKVPNTRHTLMIIIVNTSKNDGL